MIYSSTLHCNIADLLKLVTDMTTRLDPGCFDCSSVAHSGMNSLFCFLCDLDLLDTMIDSVSFCEDLRPCADENQTLHNFQAACQRLHVATNLARQSAFCSLPLCSDFKATPTLVYLLEYHDSSTGFPIEDLYAISGVVEVNSTMREYYHHTVRSSYNGIGIWLSRSKPLHQIFGNGDKPSWRTEGAWRDLRVTLAHRSLEVILDNF